MRKHKRASEAASSHEVAANRLRAQLDRARGDRHTLKRNVDRLQASNLALEESNRLLRQQISRFTMAQEIGLRTRWLSDDEHERDPRRGRYSRSHHHGWAGVLDDAGGGGGGGSGGDSPSPKQRIQKRRRRKRKPSSSGGGAPVDPPAAASRGMRENQRSSLPEWQRRPQRRRCGGETQRSPPKSSPRRATENKENAWGEPGGDGGGDGANRNHRCDTSSDMSELRPRRRRRRSSTPPEESDDDDDRDGEDGGVDNDSSFTLTRDANPRFKRLQAMYERVYKKTGGAGFLD